MYILTQSLFGQPNFISNNGIRQTDGKYVIVGQFNYYSASYAPMIVRITPSGGIDPDFFPSSGFDFSGNGKLDQVTMAYQPDGKILIGGDFTGSYSGSTNTIKRLIRITNSGSLDTDYLNNPTNPFDGQINAIVIQPDRKIVVVGAFSNYSGSSCPGIVRLLPSGAIDPDFTIGTGFSTNTGVVFTKYDVIQQETEHKLFM